MTLCGLFIVVGITRLGGIIASQGHGKEMSHPNFHRQYCPTYKTWDYSQDDPIPSPSPSEKDAMATATSCHTPGVALKVKRAKTRAIT